MTVILENCLTIEGIEQPTILQYFDTLNGEKFTETAQLFSEQGVLYPPFEEGVVGQKAIAIYLETEAKGLKLFPKQGKITVSEEGYSLIEVKGKVETPLFGVNVGWTFELNPQEKINKVEVKLLASLQELLGLQKKREEISH
ncbi:MAG: ketosteroid isomerase family protein [Microcystaceae cyanobacterium]